jgi:Anti-sigma-K factor rskA, C-terminal/Anti-sigma-K factor RskA, N-terminal domain
MRLGRPEPHPLTGAYALDALTGSELDRFERHLPHCPACGSEVRDFRETAARLAVAVAATPPAPFRPRVLRAVSATRQDPPLIRGRAGRPPVVRWLAVAVAAAAVVAAVTLGIVQSVTQHQLNRAQAQIHSAAAVLAAPDARLTVRATTAGGTATVVSSRSRHAMIITTAGLPALGGGRVYEVWFMAPGRIREAGLLPQPTAGRTSPLLATGLAAGDRIGVTVEPAGGTRQPTTTPILVMTLNT